MKKTLYLLLCLFASTFAKAQWALMPRVTSSVLYSCSFGDSSTVYAVGSYADDTSTILKSNDGGLTFYNLGASFMPSGQLLTSCYFTSKDTGFVAGYTFSFTGPMYSNSFIYKTTNGGTSWTSVLSGAATAFQSITFNGSSNGYAVGGIMTSGAKIYTTTDGGNTWSSIYTGSGVTLSGVSMPDATTAYVAGQNSSALKAKFITAASGSVTANVDLSAYDLFGATCFLTADTGFATGYDTAAGAGYIVAKTTDGGITWSTVDTSGTWGARCIRFVDHSLGYAVGDTTLITTDGGNTWTGFTLPSSSRGLGSINWMDVKGDNRIIVGEDGLIMRYTAPVITTTGVQTMANELNAVLYPNPMSNSATISFATAQTNATASITDVAGREVKSIAFSGKSVAIEKGNMQAGVYTVHITSAAGAANVKMVVE